MKKTLLAALLISIFLWGVVSPVLATPIVAYEVPAGTAGNQAYGGSLGMDFNVLHEIAIRSLGAFDSNSDGLNSAITVQLYDRNDTAIPLAELLFNSGDTGTLIGGSRFLPLETPLLLKTGFQGSIVASGYGISELNGNSHGTLGVWSTNDGGGILDFVGGSRSGLAGAYPTRIDSGPENRYAAGSFTYEPVPEPATMFLLGTGLVGIAGTVRKRKKKQITL